jgi:hypothetical protein
MQDEKQRRKIKKLLRLRKGDDGYFEEGLKALMIRTES